MTEPSLIEINDLGKQFRLYARPVDRLAEWLSGNWITRHETKWALRHVSFQVRRGECVGIIGRNGAGKSTLLKLIVGALHPTEGTAAIRGRLLALLELGAGFSPDLTGRQNVLMSSELLGFPPGYAATKMNDIESFAELGEFFDLPVRTYSSGMFVRLAFSTFVFLDPEIFVIDEALSVGDLFFQQKCFEAIRRIRANGTALLFVSHDMASIRNMCDRVLVIEGGRVTFDGPPDQAVMHYYHLQRGGPVGVTVSAAGLPALSGDETVEELRSHSILNGQHRLGSRSLEITAARCRDEHGLDTMEVLSGESLTFDLLVHARERIDEPNVGLEVYDRYHQLVYGISLRNLGHVLPSLAPGEAVIVRFRVKFSLMPSEYSIALATADQHRTDDPNSGSFLDRHDKLGPLTVYWKQPLLKFFGVADLPTEFEVLRVA